MGSAFAVKSNNTFFGLVLNSLDFLSFFFPRGFIVLCFIFKCVRLRLNYIYVFSFFAYKHLIAKGLFVEKIIFPPFNWFCISVKNHLVLFMWLYFCGLNSAPLIWMSIPLGKLYSIDYGNYIKTDYIAAR